MRFLPRLDLPRHLAPRRRTVRAAVLQNIRAVRVADALQVRLAYEAGRLTYEARLPLEYLGHPSYSIDLATKPRVGVAVRIPKPESLQMQPALSGRDRRRDGALGTIGGGRGSRGPRSDYVAPSGAIELWAKIHLAPSATSER